MPTNAIVQFSFGGLPSGYCFQGFDRFALDIVNNMSGFIPGEYSVIIDSGTEPDAEDRDKLWHKQLPGGAPTGRLYSYYLGKWVTPHQIEAEAEMRMWWTGTEADLWAFDGGDGSDPSASAPTATTGAMWVRDTDYDFKFPLAMGTSPAPLSTSVVPGDTGGVEQNTLDASNLPSHTHAIATSTNAVNGSTDLTSTDYIAKWGGSNEGAYTLAPEPGELTPTLGLTGPTGEDSGTIAALNNLPPYRVGMWAKRSARVYLVA